MHIHITPRHLTLTSAIHSYVADRFSHFEDITPDIIGIHAVLWHDQTHGAKLPFVAKIHVALPGPDLHGEASGRDLYAVVDAATDIILQQLRKRKTKRQEHNKHVARRTREKAKSTGRGLLGV
ncbi:MAG: ribosome-associated translation inhibitor RaiA [Verrucomicrobiae bacterium]|nr:ribosome-associated translation inhibitor RaiA [Verrucomicrobiae bacterium]